MGTASHEAARLHLLARRHDVLERCQGALARAEEELDSREIEPVENATELWDARVLALLSDADAAHLTQILAALQRIEQGRYGGCVACHQPIDPERLAALPEASRCISCQDDAT